MPDEKTIHIKPPHRVAQAAFFALIMLGVFLLFEAVGAARDLGVPTPPVNTITVNGTGQASLAPDIAHVTFSIIQQAATAADAQTAATKQGNAAIAYVKQQGIADADVTTLSYDISPQYSYPTPCPIGGYCPNLTANPPQITGYQVSETVQITVRDLTKVSALLQGLGQQGVQNVSGPNFGLADPNAGDDAARAKAIASAKQEAQIEAAQLGVSLVRIVSFSENGGGNYPMYNAMSAGVAGAPSPTPDIPVGQNQYTSNVSITYEIR